MYKPEMHEDFQIDQKVSFDVAELVKGTGQIVGIASTHIIFHYIVLLDKPLDVLGYENHRAISVSGCSLKKI